MNKILMISVVLAGTLSASDVNATRNIQELQCRTAPAYEAGLSFNEIVEISKIVRQEYFQIESALQTEIEALRFAAFQKGRELNDSEHDQYEQLRSQQSDCRDEVVTNAYRALKAMDNLMEAARLTKNP